MAQQWALKNNWVAPPIAMILRSSNSPHINAPLCPLLCWCGKDADGGTTYLPHPPTHQSSSQPTMQPLLAILE